MKNNLTYRLYMSVKLNRPFKDTDSISFGSVTVCTENDEFTLDFLDICVYHESDTPCDVRLVEMKNPNYEDFEDCSRIRKKDLENVTSIRDVYIDEDETDLEVVSVLEAAFMLPYDNFRQIAISESACSYAEFCA